MMRRSQASARANPAPAAAPGKAASVGLGILNSLPAVPRWTMRWRWIAWSMVNAGVADSLLLRAFIPLTSPPAQKPLPAPVTTMHLTAGSSSAEANWVCSARFIGSDIALRASGRFKVSVRMPSPSRLASRSVVPVSMGVLMAGS